MPMHQALGDGITAFERALRNFRQSLAADPPLEETVFRGAGQWIDLLTYKLVPQLAGEGCLIIAVSGGTNTGKSTVFNLLLGESLSPVRATAAATARPLLAASPRRIDECLEGRLVPEFVPQRLSRGDDVIGDTAPPETLFVAPSKGLPDRLALLDTPDVDSIEKIHWEVADHIRAAGDVVVAVLTGEKYRDERVVAFFQEARQSGRVVVPVMNKANPKDGFAIAREQLAQFCADTGLDGPSFVIPHDFALAETPNHTIAALDGGAPLMEYLLSLDTAAIKERVYRDTLRRMAAQAESFLDQAEASGEVLRAAARDFDERTRRAAREYDPAPGPEVGGLFHEYVQEKRGGVRKAIGAMSKTVVRGILTASRGLRRALLNRRELERTPQPKSDAEMRELHAQKIKNITRELATWHIERSRTLREPAHHLVLNGVEGVDADEALDKVIRETLRAEGPSEEFRQHAKRMLDAWWEDHRGQRHIVEALDAVLAVAPAAIAVPIAIYTGPGLPEATLGIAGPFVEQFAARVFEYQFGDAMFDFLSPWRREQQEALEASLQRHLTGPALARLHEMMEPFESDALEQMRQWQEEWA